MAKREPPAERKETGALDAARAGLSALRRAAESLSLSPRTREIGRVLNTGDGIARIAGLPGARSQEVIAFPGGAAGMAFNLDPDEVGVVLLDAGTSVSAGDTVRGTGEVVRTPVGRALLGRVVDPLGRPLDGGPDLSRGGAGAAGGPADRPVETEAPGITARAPVVRPLATGIKVIDAMVPIGRGQRELIVGDRTTGKTTVALDTILNQRGEGVICVYVAIGQRASSVARVVETLRRHEALSYSVVVAADADSPPGLRFIAPYAGCAVSEHFMEEGRDTLIVYDDLTKHAQTYREISLLLRRPPGREAYPGDIFFIHSRLLERATQLDEAHGGGSQTALPIVETQAQNIAAYVPTNLISITDGQIYLNPDLFHEGILPAVDVGLSVSRVGGKTQIPAMKRLAQSLRLTYAQFAELELFAKFGTALDADTRRTLERGRRLRELLKQPAGAPVPLAEQVLLLEVAARHLLDGLPVERVAEFEERFRRAARERVADLLERLRTGGTPSEEDVKAIEQLARDVIGRLAQDKASRKERRERTSGDAPQEAAAPPAKEATGG